MVSLRRRPLPSREDAMATVLKQPSPVLPSREDAIATVVKEEVAPEPVQAVYVL